MTHLTPPVNENDHVLGSPQALITLVQYGDYQCPHCADAHLVVKWIGENLERKLRFVYRHFPLSRPHPLAFTAAISAEAAAVQGKFREMHAMLFERQPMISEFALLEFAQELSLDMKEFRKDLMSPALQKKVESDIESGKRSGVNGTPCFFINGFRHKGSFDYHSMLNTIEEHSHPVF